MKKQLEMMKVAVKFEDAESFTKHDFEFHETLIKASNHQYLNSFWSHLKPVMMALVLTSMRQRMQQNPQDLNAYIIIIKCLLMQWNNTTVKF